SGRGARRPDGTLIHRADSLAPLSRSERERRRRISWRAFSARSELEAEVEEGVPGAFAVREAPAARHEEGRARGYGNAPAEIHERLPGDRVIAVRAEDLRERLDSAEGVAERDAPHPVSHAAALEDAAGLDVHGRSEEHTSELQSLTNL